MAELTWNILRVSWDEQTGGIVNVMWLLVAEEDGYEGVVKGSTDFVPEPDSSSFIPLDDVDEAQVQLWVQNNVKNREGLEKLAVERLGKKKIPATVRGLPWADL